MTPSPGNRSRLQSEINVTPLVDVCLVMLGCRLRRPLRGQQPRVSNTRARSDDGFQDMGVVSERSPAAAKN